MPKRRQKKLDVKAARLAEDGPLRRSTSEASESRREKKKKIDKIDSGVILEKKTAEDVEKEKLLLMRVGVAGVMVVFVIAWIFNLKYQFKINSNNQSKSSFSWEETKAELDKAMNQVKQGISEIKKIQTTNQQNTLPQEPELTDEQINLLKGKLLGEVASSTTASSTKK